MDKKLMFIINPRAGRTRSHAPLFDAAAVYSEAGYLVSIRSTCRRGDATLFAAEAAGWDLVVCYGGDGTLNETINGLMRIPVASRPPLSYLPGGSTNDFAASLSIPSDLSAAAQSAMRLQPRMLDVGRLGDRFFMYVASFGAFTRASYSAPQDIKNMFGHFAYILQGVRDISTLRPYRVTLTADDEVFDGEYLFGAVSNSTSIAGMMKLESKDVAFDDGRFELLLVPVPKSAAAVSALMRALLYREYEGNESVIFRHVRRVAMTTEENLPWTLDGEFVPGAPRVDISIEDNGVVMFL